MHEHQGRSSADTDGLGALLVLLHRADAAFDCVEVTYRIWRRNERADAAWHAAVEQERRRGTSSVSTHAVIHGAEPPAETEEEVLRLWRDGDRVRTEHEGGSQDGAYAVRVGEVWWSWTEYSGAMSNQDDRSVGSNVGEEVSLLLAPTPLLAVLRFTPAGPGNVAGRKTVSAEAVPRFDDHLRPLGMFELHQIGAGADRYVLQFDAERGVLLEVVALRRDEPFLRITTDRVAFDQPIAPERFTFQPPPGEEIKSTWERHRLTHVSLVEAQARAPFTVLIPAPMPEDWQVRCAFIEASVRPPSSECVTLTYHSDRSRESVSLSEYAATDKPDHYALMGHADDWQTVTRDGIDIRVRGLGSQRQAYIEREGTFAFLMSETLSVDQLVGLAARLSPAPGTSSI